MASPHELPHESEIAAPDYRQKLADAYDARHDRPEMPERYLEIMTTVLEAGFRHYGDPSRDNYQEFHNDVHFFNVATGSWRGLDVLRNEFDMIPDSNDYVVGGLVGVLHDIVRKSASVGIVEDNTYTVDFGVFSVAVSDDGTESDESLSAKMAVLFLDKVGVPKKIQRRVGKGILLTEVIFKEDGNVIQTRAGKGGHDYGAIAAAIADTEGIFADDTRTPKDLARLGLEITGKDSDQDAIVIEQINKLIKAEPLFIQQKLAEASLHIMGTEDDPDKKRQLGEAFERHFAPYIQRALGIAALFDPRSDNLQSVQETIFGQIERIRLMKRRFRLK